MSNKVKRRYLVVVFLWVIFTVIAFAYFSKQRLVEFDKHRTLQEVDYIELGQYLKRFSSSYDVDLRSRVIHFSKMGCECQQFSESHIDDINGIAFENDFDVTNIIIEHDEVIPAVPSVAILDQTGDVIYFGPYGQGLGCSQTSGFAQTMLNNFLKGFSANIVIREAKGCYCLL